jgi:hypothetical protein
VYSGGERMREEIKAGSLYVFRPQIQPSVGFDRICQTHACTPAYVQQIRQDPAENHRENPPRVPFQPTVQIPSRVPFLPTVQMPSTSVFNRRPDPGRRTKRLRERWVSDMIKEEEINKQELQVGFKKKKKKRQEKKRKDKKENRKRKKKNVTDGFF